MTQNLFKIFDGRTNFWQWDTKQKLIVLDDRVTEVHFSNRGMRHAIRKEVYKLNGQRLCNIPDIVLQLPRNLVAYACEDGTTIKSVKFAVMERPIPDDYVMDRPEAIDDKFAEIDMKLETLNDTKADNIYRDEDGGYVQLMANGEPIGNKVDIASGDNYIEDCKINAEGHLIVTLVGGKEIDAGYVGTESGATFTPHVSEDLILSWSNDKGLDNPEPVDISPFNDWIDIEDDGETKTQYVWDYM